MNKGASVIGQRGAVHLRSAYALTTTGVWHFIEVAPDRWLPVDKQPTDRLEAAAVIRAERRNANARTTAWLVSKVPGVRIAPLRPKGMRHGR